MSLEVYLANKLQTVVSRRRAITATGEAALGAAALATVGCESEGPPDFTIHTDGYVDRLKAIPEMFGDAPVTQTILRKVPSGEILRVGQTTFKKSHHPLDPAGILPDSENEGTLQILLPEIYKSPPKGIFWKKKAN